MMRTLRFLAVLAIGFVAFPALLLRAGTLKAIYTFGTAYPDAQTPHGALVFDKSGNLYGATTFGGENDLGTIFELSPDGNGGWNKAVLYDFCAMPNCADGSHANGGLIFDSQGNLYGTTMVGGKNGTGTVFKLSHDADKHAWQEDVLYSFRASRSGDGNYPKMGLVLDNRGNLYGTTWGGGSSNCGCGAVFELTPSNQQWTETVLYAFTAEGAGTTNPLIFNSDQTVLYGAGPGGVFQLAYKDGQWNESEVYSFGYDTNDIVGITRDTSNNLYGVLINGGSGQGLAFELTYQNGAWTENTIYTFSNNGAIYPSSPLLFDPTQTHLFGTSTAGGANDLGSVYELTKAEGSWTQSVVYSFSRSQKSEFYSSLIMDSKGNLYGTASNSGHAGCYQNLGCGYVLEVTP